MEEFRAELSGILRWAIDGFYKYKNEEDRLAIPDKVLKARESLKIQTDALGPFLDEFVIDADSSVTLLSSDIYKVYVEWAKESNEHVYSKKKLTQMLQERGWRTAKNRDKIICFVGKALSASASQAGGLF
jgi:phage/plasmid-associated DNA primase